VRRTLCHGSEAPDTRTYRRQYRRHLTRHTDRAAVERLPLDGERPECDRGDIRSAALRALHRGGTEGRGTPGPDPAYARGDVAQAGARRVTRTASRGTDRRAVDDSRRNRRDPGVVQIPVDYIHRERPALPCRLGYLRQGWSAGIPDTRLHGPRPPELRACECAYHGRDELCRTGRRGTREGQPGDKPQNGPPDRPLDPGR